MGDTLRYSFFGEIVHYASGGRLMQYVDERPDFVLPLPTQIPSTDASSPSETVEKTLSRSSLSSSTAADVEKTAAAADTEAAADAAAGHKDPDLVTWYGPDDPENPQNWSSGRKMYTLAMFCVLTVSVYMGSSIYTPGITELMEEFQVSAVVAALPLTLYVIGYGIGPMVLAPLSEIPAVGRNMVYIPTLLLFVILQIPSALTRSIGGLIVARFFAGFFSSPALATCGASIGDILLPQHLPYGIAVWGASGSGGPAFGPLLGGVFAQVKNWRWTFWCLMWISGASFILLFFTLPETNPATILHRRARRLRKRYGNEKFYTAGEIEFSHMTARQMVYNNLVRPFVILTVEPPVVLLNLYTAFIYAVLYTWFEAFPIVFEQIHHFNLIESGLTYLGIVIGCNIVGALYCLLFKTFVMPQLMRGARPEVLFKLSFYFSPIIPLALLFFGWTSSADIHWIVPIVASGTFMLGGFVVFQVVFNYLGMSYPRFLASVFAGNAFFRSCLASVFPLFASHMFTNLGPSKFPVGYGSTILAAVGVIMMLLPVLFYRSGELMRAKSRFAN
ncbi:major facilitator superfamily domain-containing protein [Lipomyces japonicus]|uniref:major facilitator superfamily domain-containing protein n=1 Tax=Lipomyces japonicus TaxID=56871 RepID=UPI0034CF585A